MNLNTKILIGVSIGIAAIFLSRNYFKNRAEKRKTALDHYFDWFYTNTDWKDKNLSVSEKERLKNIVIGMNQDQLNYIKSSIESGDVSNSNIRLLGLIASIKMDFQNKK